MRRKINNIISVAYSLLKFSFLKIIYRERFQFYFIERFSPNTDIYFLGSHGKIILGKRVRAHSFVRLRVVSDGKIIIGDNTTMNYGCMITSRNKIIVGTGVEFGPNVLLYDHDHDFRAPGGLKANKFKSGNIIIGNNCWIGANTVILKNTILGNNCVVGAGSVLSGKFADNTLIVQKRDTEVKNIEMRVS